VILNWPPMPCLIVAGSDTRAKLDGPTTVGPTKERERLQGCQVADLSAIFADFGLMEKLLAEWKNPIWPLLKVAESGLIESILAE
jgi:hypothetical protein